MIINHRIGQVFKGLTVTFFQFIFFCIFSFLGSEELKKAKEETKTLDEELKKHRDKVLMLKNSTKTQISDLESVLQETKEQLVGEN